MSAMRLRRQREPYEFSELATFNGERARGIMHTPEWEARMAADQERFNAQQLAEAEREGWTVVVAVPHPPTNDWPIFSVEGQSSYSSERLKRDASSAAVPNRRPFEPRQGAAETATEDGVTPVDSQRVAPHAEGGRTTARTTAEWWRALYIEDECPTAEQLAALDQEANAADLARRNGAA